MSKSLRNVAHLLFALIACVTLAPKAIAERAPLPELRIGSPAPPLKVMKWIKGAPVNELQQGQVYVVELWATWCGPCIKAMPHISEVAKTYEGRATVMGVSISERLVDRTEENILALVEPFVERQGERMEYHVAADGPDEIMRNTWFKAAGRTGIPATFIVGKDKKIAWIGHPMEMDDVLPKVIDGTWDVKAAAKKQAEEWEREQDVKEAVGPIVAALQAKDFKTVAAAAEAAIKKYPEMEEELRPVRFEALLRTDEPAAYAFMRECAQNKVFEKSPVDAYNFFIAMTRNAGSLNDPNWAGLAEALETANAAREKPLPPMLTALATVYARLSNFEKAAAAQKKAIAAAKADSPPPPAAWLDQQEKKLAEYESK